MEAYTGCAIPLLSANVPGLCPACDSILNSMRLQSTILQCWFTAAFLVATLTSCVSADAEPDDINIRGEIIGNGGGLPVALDSFNGLEIRETQEDGESDGLDLVRRYPSNGKSLGNNAYQETEIKIGEVQWWWVTKQVVNSKKANPGPGLPPYIHPRSWDSEADTHHELRKRDEELSKRSNTLYLSLTTCKKPVAKDSDSDGSFHQLEVYVSQSHKLQKPGPGKDNLLQTMTKASGGYMGQAIDANGDVFIGVAAPNTTDYTGTYQYQIAASVDAYFHAVNNTGPFLYFVDSSQHAALLVTNNLTQSNPDSENYQRWMNITPPYTMFAHNTNSSALVGLERSFCALDALAQVGRISKSVQVGMTSRGLGNKPKEQFYITGLRRSSLYNGILAMTGNSIKWGNGIVGGGGTLWQPMNFSTKAGQYIPYFSYFWARADRYRQQLCGTIQPVLLLRSRIRRPVPPRAKRQETSIHLRQLRPEYVHQLHLLPPTSPVQHLRKLNVFTSRELLNLRNSIQAMAMFGQYSAVRGFFQSGTVPASSQHSAEFH